MKHFVYRLLALTILILPSWQTRAEEGMWIPMLLKQLNESHMQQMGMRLSAEDIYSVNQSSLKDAIVHFGGFCTGEMISAEGLLLTNHHCALGQIQRHSSVANDLISNGFWARSRSEELTNPGLFARFLIRMEDVTKSILEGISESTTEEDRQRIITERIAHLEKQAVENTHYEANIRPFFYGNEYYLFITETFPDVRMAGAPPASIGKFGGDTDNWMWPRHTGDFALFRVYTAPDGSPAEYHEDNIPYRPRHHFPISLKGVQPGDFTMVFGYPGRTEQYLHSRAIEDIIENINPQRIALRDMRLNILQAEMDKSDEVRIQYTSKYARISNHHKKWVGENWGLLNFNALDRKYARENDFARWSSKRKNRKLYGGLLNQIQEQYDRRQGLELVQQYRMEAILAPEIVMLAYRLNPFLKLPDNEEQKRKILEQAETMVENHFKDYHTPADRQVFVELLSLYIINIPEEFHTESMKEHANNLGSLFDASALKNESFIKKILQNPSDENINKLRNDVISIFLNEYESMYAQKVQPVLKETGDELDRLYRRYIQGLREMEKYRAFYPDANSTLRITYGKVDGYVPRDATSYLPVTSLDGVMEKHDPDHKDFTLPKKLIQLYEEQDYGIYKNEEGKLPVCFIASNHTTGGNSGSPVINADGHLIGLNFDRSWESTMSDYNYDPQICRNISVDIRYVLFIIDKFAGAGHLLEEMTLVQ
ncbi:MAG: S46 family peptidase [Cyclobacteriaceae bacterium]|nr:S46 family peptidase [Cyclobacteriaceae bacterium]